MTRISATEISDDMADIVNRVADGGEWIVVGRRGKDVAAIVSMDDLRRLEAMEDAYWTGEAERALAEARHRREQPIPFEVVERRIEASRSRRRKTGTSRRRVRKAR